MNFENIKNDIEKRALGLNDAFQFGCKACGKCCRDKVIMLNPYDIFQLTKHLNMSQAEFAKKYCGFFIGEESNLPIVYLDFKGGPCPFLVNKRCSVHKVKPFVCASYLLGRAISGDKLLYFRQEVSCGNKYEKQVVRDWVYGSRNAKEEEQIYLVWSQILQMLVPITSKIPANEIAPVANMLGNSLYFSYDIHNLLLPQLEARLEDTKFIVEGLKLKYGE